MDPDYVLFCCKDFTARIFIDPSKPFTPIHVINDPRVDENKRETLRQKYHTLEYYIISCWDGREILEGFYIGAHKVPPDKLDAIDLIRASEGHIKRYTARALIQSYKQRPVYEEPMQESFKNNMFSFGSQS